mgnify:CR=1 FL=1
MDSAGQLIFFLLTPLSHIGASLFFAKPRFPKWITAAIWLLYVAMMMILPPDTLTANFFLTLAAHFILTGYIQTRLQFNMVNGKARNFLHDNLLSHCGRSWQRQWR